MNLSFGFTAVMLVSGNHPFYGQTRWALDPPFFQADTKLDAALVRHKKFDFLAQLQITAF
jgi:hypothetical protein